ncbi:MAG: DUF3971 domain-containing protein, partial [Oleibacter sp.]|nr:DUF3971 domain-containing protein [Thalassolituus sp.]
WPWNKQNGRIYIGVDQQDWLRWIPDDLPRELQIDQLEGGLEGWLTVRDGDLESLYVNASVKQLNLVTPENNLALNDGNIFASGERNGDDWHVSLQPSFDVSLPVNEIRVSSVMNNDKRGWQVAIPEADIATLSQFILDFNILPVRFEHYLENIQPTGRVEQARLSYMPKDKVESDSDANSKDNAPSNYVPIEIQANVLDLHTQGYIGIPEMRGVDGSVRMQPSGGVAVIKDPDLTIHLADVYQPEWELSNASAKFYWHLEDDFFRLNLRDLKATLKETKITGELALRVPRDDSDVENHIGLLLHIDDGPLSLQQDLVPDILDPAIIEWLDSGLVSGNVSNVSFVLNGHIGSEIPDQSLTSQLTLDSKNTRIRYLDGWPEIINAEGHVYLDSPSLDVTINEGQTLGGSLVKNSGRVRIRDTAAGTRLRVNATLNGSTGEALAYLQKTPLAELTDNALSSWEASGAASTQFNLSMLMDDNSTPDVQLTSQLRNTRLALNDVGLQFSNVNGALTFDTDTGLFTEGLTAQAFGGKVSADITSKKIKDNYQIELKANGAAQWNEVNSWLDLFFLDPISGTLNYQAQLSINPSASQVVNLVVESKLKDTVIDFPAPLGKSGAEEKTLTLLVRPGDETEIRVNYTDLLRTAILLDDSNSPHGQVTLGDLKPQLGISRGIDIFGNINTTVNAEEWWNVWLRLSELMDDEGQDLVKGGGRGSGRSSSDGSRTEATDNPLGDIDITIAGIDAWDIAMAKTRVVGQQDAGRWNLQVDNDVLRGNVVIDDSNAPISLLLDYIHLPMDEDEPQPLQTANETPQAQEFVPFDPQADPLIDLLPQDLSDIDLTVQELYIGTRNYGRWQVRARRTDTGIRLYIDDSDIKGLKLKGDLYWDYIAGQHQTRIENLILEGSDLAEIQKAFRQEVMINGKEIDGKFDVQWRGSPLAFNSQTLNGLVYMRIRNGSLQAEGTGAVRALGAFNVNNLFRRLRLDFSDVVEPGLSFDVIKGTANLQNGVLQLSEPLTMDGASGKFLMSGNANLNTSVLDMKLAVTLPVTNSLPLVAILAGLAPPVAASIFVTERLIGNELERFTSASYSITGVLEAPKVELNKAFDNKVDGKEKLGIKDRILNVFGLGGEEE